MFASQVLCRPRRLAAGGQVRQPAARPEPARGERMAGRDQSAARGEERGADAGRLLVAAGAAASAAARAVGTQGVATVYFSILARSSVNN